MLHIGKNKKNNQNRWETVGKVVGNKVTCLFILDLIKKITALLPWCPIGYTINIILALHRNFTYQTWAQHLATDYPRPCLRNDWGRSFVQFKNKNPGKNNIASWQILSELVFRSLKQKIHSLWNGIPWKLCNCPFSQKTKCLVIVPSAKYAFCDSFKRLDWDFGFS